VPPKPFPELARRLELPLLEWYDDVDSTQEIVRSLADRGGKEWSIVAADHQRKGRGQHGRHWADESGSGLTFSVLLYPHTIEALSVLPIRVGLAIARSLVQTIAEPSKLMVKWPNDLVIERLGWSGKVGGVLCEAQVRGDACTAVVGVGVNLHPFVVDDSEFNEPMAFLAEHTAGEISRMALFEIIVAGLRNGLRWSDRELTYGEIMEYERFDSLRGHRITSPVVGTAWGITRTGGLVVQNAKGECGTVLTGTVRRG